MRSGRTRLGILLAIAVLGFTLTAIRAQISNPPGAPDDHFMCYRVRNVTPGGFSARTVTLADQYSGADGSVRVVKPSVLCAPADKRGEGIVDEITHLEGYRVKPSEHVLRQQVDVSNQFGQLVLEIRKLDRLLVPTTKNLNTDPAPPGQNNVDHFACYQARVAGGQPGFDAIASVAVSDSSRRETTT